MSLMREFTYDVESVELTSEECNEFASLVRSACHANGADSPQHKLSLWLSNNPRPQPSSVQDYAQRLARFMWRTEVRTM